MKLDLMNFFTKTPKIHLYIQPFILKYGSSSNIFLNDSIPFPLCYSQIRLLTFHSFAFLSIPLF